MQIIIERLLKALELTSEFYQFLPESSLALKIPSTPSNKIGEQAWCIVGARESYLKALKKGEWDGFSCTLEETLDKNQVIFKLKKTYADLNYFLQHTRQEDLNFNLLIDLLEHEIQHHGQLIRYSYANRLGFPKSWNERYSV